MKRYINTVVVLSIFFLCFQFCAPCRYVKPLSKKTQAASFSFGGPIIKFSGAPIPIPYTTLGYGYGLTDRVTGYGNLHTTSLLFGNLQTDFGATIGLYEKAHRFGISTSPGLQVAYHAGDSKSGRLWPSIDLNAYYHPRNKPSYIYGGLNAWFELSGVKAHQESVQQHMVPNLNLGFVRIARGFQHQFQLSYLGIGSSILPGVVEYIGIAGKGSLGIHYALIKTF